MKTWMLLTMLAQDPIMYEDQKTCELAMMKLNTAADNTSVCIPAGIQEPKVTVTDPLALFEQMMNMVTEMNINLNKPPKEVDIQEE